MRSAFSLIVAILLSTSVWATTVHASYFYENLRIVRGPVYQSNIQSSRTPTGSICLYRNSYGECMIEQYPTYGSWSYNRYYPRTPTYSRSYLYNERRYSNRDDDDSDDDDIYDYRYFDDDDDYQAIEDDDDFYDDEDDFDYDDFFDDDDDNDSDDDDDDSDDDDFDDDDS